MRISTLRKDLRVVKRSEKVLKSEIVGNAFQVDKRSIEDGLAARSDERVRARGTSKTTVFCTQR